MKGYAEFELGLHQQNADTYSVEMRFCLPDSEADTRPEESSPQVQFDSEALRSHEYDLSAYGRSLSADLFVPPVKEFISRARAIAQAAETPLRLRLQIDSNASKLHHLLWETLRDPDNDTLLFTSENLLFSRYLNSQNWRPVHLRRKGDVRALVVIANPSNLAEYQLAPLEAAKELEHAQAGLSDIPTTVLVRGDPGQPATLDNLMAHLREGHDLLYLVCHGLLEENEPWLWLEDEAGRAQRVKGEEWVARLKELSELPRLIVLASCQSASTSGTDALTALGPRLAEAGVPAVLAMRGNITLKTIGQFMPVFFKELDRDGQIDRALAVARGAVRDHSDSWMPALFMRLKSGRLWYAPGFDDDHDGLKKWPALITHIQDKECTPILGPGLLDKLLGSRRELTGRWAQAHNYPLAPHEREDLTHVAQYLAAEQNAKHMLSQLREFMREALLKRYGPELGTERLKSLGVRQLFTVAGEHLRKNNPLEPHRVLASLPFSIYITANPDNLLAEALIAQGKQPCIHVCKWNDVTMKLSSPADDLAYQPTPDQPLVCHLFGSLEHRGSVTLTEDDYFDYLISISRDSRGDHDIGDMRLSHRAGLPPVVCKALASSALLFLGFDVGDRNFRVIFRLILNQAGSAGLDGYTHVTAQIDPEEGHILEPQRARTYLENYFQRARKDMHVFWGSVEDFTAQLHRHWQEKKTPHDP